MAIAGRRSTPHWVNMRGQVQGTISGYYDDWTVGTLYSTSNPTIQPTSATAFASLTGFSETATKNEGEIRIYQVSNDGGTTWVLVQLGLDNHERRVSEASTASDINANISSFPAGSGQFLWRAYLHSDGTQLVQLDNVLTYEAAQAFPQQENSSGGGHGSGAPSIAPRRAPHSASPRHRRPSPVSPETQKQAILKLLLAFGADQPTIDNVSAALNGQPAPIATSTVPTLTRNLYIGLSGDDVSQLQHSSKTTATTPIPEITGYFGPITKAAVAAFRQAHGIEAPWAALARKRGRLWKAILS